MNINKFSGNTFLSVEDMCVQAAPKFSMLGSTCEKSKAHVHALILIPTLRIKTESHSLDKLQNTALNKVQHVHKQKQTTVSINQSIFRA